MNEHSGRNNSKDPLATLWNTQKSSQQDPEMLKKLWRKNRLKQWLWVVSDLIVGLFSVVLCLWFLTQDYILLKKVWVAAFLIFGLLITPWVIALRYRSLSSKVATSEYLERLRQQKHNNIRIAEATIKICILLGIFYLIWNGVYYFWHSPELTDYLLGTAKGVAFLLIVAGGLYWWARREIRINQAELTLLE